MNDIDGYLINALRALKADPDKVAEWADCNVCEADLHAKHHWLVDRVEWIEKLKHDPDLYDAKMAGWWIWGLSMWIGSGWCNTQAEPSDKLPHLRNAGIGVHRTSISDQLPRLSGAQGVHRCSISDQLPHLGNPGRGVHRRSVSDQLPHLGGQFGTGEKGVIAARRHGLVAYFERLSERLRYVRICCGDWKRVTGPSVTTTHGLTAVFLDAPYSIEDRDPTLYRMDSQIIAKEIYDYARANENEPLLKLAVCGYVGEHQFPDTWECYEWKAAGGYGLQGNGQGRENAKRERIWFSPRCAKRTMFEDMP